MDAKSILYQTLICVTLVLISFTCIGKAAFNKQILEIPADQELAKVADEIASQYNGMWWFSGSVLVVKEGREVFNKSYGYQKLETAIPNTDHTRYNLGSIMKDFTKVLVLQQVEKNKFKLSDTLDKFRLGFPKEIASKITIEHLMNHRAGFRDIFTAEYRENQLVFDTLEKKLNLLKNDPLLFEPGSDHRYTNYGYIVLGAILQKATGKPFDKLFESGILGALLQSNTTFHPDPTSRFQSVRYTYLFDDSIQNVGVTEHPGPDGGGESTIHDVHRIYKSLFYSKNLVNIENALVRKVFAMDGEHWASYGGGKGISAAVEMDLKNEIEIVVLANTDSLVAELISARILQYIRTGEYEKIKPREINFAWNYYSRNSKDAFYRDFEDDYKEAGYTQFIGRTINELGMQLLAAEKWPQAMDIFHYLVELFPGAPQAYDSLAYAFKAQGKMENATETFAEALKIKSDFNSEYVADNYKSN